MKLQRTGKPAQLRATRSVLQSQRMRSRTPSTWMMPVEGLKWKKIIEDCWHPLLHSTGAARRGG